jgi:hypothetical protein
MRSEGGQNPRSRIPQQNGKGKAKGVMFSHTDQGLFCLDGIWLGYVPC